MLVPASAAPIRPRGFLPWHSFHEDSLSEHFRNE